MKKRILNVGCGNSVYGTDFVDLYPAKGRKEVIRCDITRQKLPFKSNIFDKVYSSFVFEHLANPEFVLKEMVRVLKKGGEIEIHTNNAGWWAYHNSKSKVKTHYGGYEKTGRSGGGTGEGTEDKHYALYTWHHLKNHLENIGLKNIMWKLYRKGGVGPHIKIIDWFLEKSRFKWMAYPQIVIKGEK